MFMSFIGFLMHFLGYREVCNFNFGYIGNSVS